MNTFNTENINPLTKLLFAIVIILVFALVLVLIWKISKTKTTLTEEIKKLDIIKSIQTVFLQYSMAKITLLTGVAALLVLTLGYLFYNDASNIGKSPDWNMIMGFTFVLTLIIATISAIYLIVFINKITNNIVKESLGFKDMFDKIQNGLDNIKNAAFTNIISWRNAGQIEIDAEKVWAISYSLKWLSEVRINQILKELDKYPEHKYRFILVKYDKIKRDAIYTKINKKILYFDRINKTNLKTRFIIKKIKSENILLPISNDIAIYQSFVSGDEMQNIVVINTREFNDNENNHEIKEEDLDNKFDIRFQEPIQVSRLITWYDSFWNNPNNFEPEPKDDKNK